MGYSVETMALFVELAERGLFSDVRKVADLGSQEMHFAEQDATSFPYRESIRRALRAIRPGVEIGDDQLQALADRSSVGKFFETVGIGYKAFDSDGWYGKPFDLNLDQAGAEDRGAYCLTVNSGTTEHLIDQANAFRIMHDLTRPGGLMVHSVPFFGSVDHGFFNYNPNFFDALARFNAYDVLGAWICPSGAAALVPWTPGILKFFDLSADKDRSISIFSVLRKTSAGEFCIPFQKGYELEQHPDNLRRYSYMVDGVRVSAAKAASRSLDGVSGQMLVRELFRRVRRRVFG